MEIYLVGGAVRDTLLKKPVTERDWVVVGANPQTLIDKGFTAVGKDFPVFLHPDSKEEYALARTERKTGHGYTGFQFYAEPDVTLEADLERRDLTINAIAQLPDGTLVDPFGGKRDIQKRILRHVSLAFREDPVRILRIARFAARFAPMGFRIADETMALMRAMVADGEVHHLVPERVWKEMSRALLSEQPQVFIEALRDCGALEVILPEIDKLFGVPQRKEHHPEIDTGIHTLMSLQQAALLSSALTVRFATLIHDLGKAETPEEMLPRHHDHEQRSLPLVTAICDRLKVPNDCRTMALLVAEFHTHCHRAFELQAKTLVKLFQRCDAFRRPERLEQFLLCCEADARGRTGFEDREYKQSDWIQTAFNACRTVSPQPFIEKGIAGKALGEQIHRERLKQINQVKRAYAFPKQ